TFGARRAPDASEGTREGGSNGRRFDPTAADLHRATLTPRIGANAGIRPICPQGPRGGIGMDENGETQLIYRLLLAVDIQGYSRRDAREQLLAQRRLSDVLDRAGGSGQAGGDGELATRPAGTDPVPVAGDFVIALAEGLREVNRGAGRFPLRVRVALHHGTMTAGPFGPAGDAPIVVQRLLDSAPLRRLLADDAGRDLAY